MGVIHERKVEIFLNRVLLDGDLCVPDNARGIVIFAHGSGSSRHSPRNLLVAQVLHDYQIGTLLFDLLTELEDYDYLKRFDIELLTHRLLDTTSWLKGEPEAKNLAFAYFGASTGAAAALKAAAVLGNKIKAVVSRGGRPDLAINDIDKVKSPTLFLVGGKDREVIEYNKQALEKLNTIHELAIIPGAGHLFEEKGTLEEVARLASEWFIKYLKPAKENLKNVAY